MNTFKLIVSSPDGNQFEGDVVRLDIRGTEGELAIMAGHIPFVTSLAKAPCKIVTETEELNAFADGGLLAVAKDKVTLISGSFRFND